MKLPWIASASAARRHQARAVPAQASLPVRVTKPGAQMRQIPLQLRQLFHQGPLLREDHRASLDF
jgi:hypothetical protein